MKLYALSGRSFRSTLYKTLNFETTSFVFNYSLYCLLNDIIFVNMYSANADSRDIANYFFFYNPTICGTVLTEMDPPGQICRGSTSVKTERMGISISDNDIYSVIAGIYTNSLVCERLTFQIYIRSKSILE